MAHKFTCSLKPHLLDDQKLGLGQFGEFSLGVNSFSPCLVHLNSGDVVDLEKSDDDDGDDERAHRKIGVVPELDPDALPSSGVQRFLTLICISSWGLA
jgi:hypothetical protein